MLSFRLLVSWLSKSQQMQNTVRRSLFSSAQTSGDLSVRALAKENIQLEGISFLQSIRTKHGQTN